MACQELSIALSYFMKACARENWIYIILWTWSRLHLRNSSGFFPAKGPLLLAVMLILLCLTPSGHLRLAPQHSISGLITLPMKASKFRQVQILSSCVDGESYEMFAMSRG